MSFAKSEWWSRGMLAAAAGVPLAVEHLIPNSWFVAAAGGVTLLSWYGDFLRSIATDRATEQQRFIIRWALASCRRDLKKVDPTARLNVMTLHRDWRFKREFVFLDRDDVANHPDRGLRLGVKQGVVGYAFREKKWAIGDFETRTLRTGIVGSDEPSNTQNNVAYNLSTDQQRATSGLTLVVSFPVPRLKSVDGNVMAFTDDIIGVVNVDTKRRNAYEYYGAPQCRAALLKHYLPNIVNIVSAMLT